MTVHRNPFRVLGALAALAVPAATLVVVASAPTAVAAPPPGCVAAGPVYECTATFASTGAQQVFAVPAGVTSVEVEAVGAAGGTSGPGGAGGRGALVTGEVPVTPGTDLFVNVGGPGAIGGAGGFNGGGPVAGNGGSGGGATDVRTVTSGATGSLQSRLVVAGGGGGAGGPGGNGGNAGAVGSDGSASSVQNDRGRGATQSAGGAAGAGDASATSGALGVGGRGAGSGFDGQISFAGAGGGGLYGGGGAGIAPGHGVAGGGGGSSLVPTGGTATVAALGAAPRLTISYELPRFELVTDPGPDEAGEVRVAAGEPVSVGFDRTADDGTVARLVPDALSIAPEGAGTGAVCRESACVATRAGLYTVSATLDGETVEVPLRVTNAGVQRLVVLPDDATVSVGDVAPFSATAYDRYDNLVGGVTTSDAVTWTVTPIGDTPDPTFTCPDGVCTPDRAGSYRVTASYALPTGDPVVGSAVLLVDVTGTEATLTAPTDPVFGDEITVTGEVLGDDEQTVPGAVQLLLDDAPFGEPVPIAEDGSVTSPSLGVLAAGLHTVEMRYAGGAGHAPAVATVAFVVAKAPTTTTLTGITPDGWGALVQSGNEGSGTPVGTVDFYRNGFVVGSAELDDEGRAAFTGDVLTDDRDGALAAVYLGSDDFAASSDSSTRRVPSISGEPSATGWQDGPVTVSFTCEAGSAPVECPEPVVVDGEGAGQYVTRTVVAADGGVATTTVGPIDIDLTAPVVRVGGISPRPYNGRFPVASCQATDELSGVASCETYTSEQTPGVLATTATATDLAGNTASSRVAFEIRDIWWGGRTPEVAGVWQLRIGRPTTLHVMSYGRPTVLNPATGKSRRAQWAGQLTGRPHWVVKLQLPASARPGRVYQFRVTNRSVERVVRVRAVGAS